MGKTSVVIGGRGVGKTFFSQILLDNVSDGDLSTKLNNVPYSTDIREVVTIQDIINHSNRCKGEF